MINACNIAKASNFKDISIVSESRYVLNSVELWLPKWIDNEFKITKNKQVVNKKLMLDLVEAKQQLTIRWLFTKGHSEDFGNSKADELAKQVLQSDSHKLGAVVKFNPEQQLRDPAIQRIHAALTDEEAEVNRRFDNFEIIDGLLYLKKQAGDDICISKLVVPADQRELMLRIAHDDQLYGGHLGVRKNLKSCAHTGGRA